MRAGAYNKRVSILRKTIKIDKFGAHEQSFDVLTTTWANVNYISGNRTVENQEIFFTQQVVFTLRSYVDVELEDRISYNSKSYRILSINDKSKDTTFNEKQIITELINS